MATFGALRGFAKRKSEALKRGAARTDEFETEKKRSGEKNWPYYTDDASSYFSKMPSWLDTVEQAFPGARERMIKTFADEGLDAAYVDLCGVASGSSLGAPRTYALTKTRPKMGLVHKDVSVHIGDVTSRRSLHELFADMKKNGMRFCGGTMMVRGGFDFYFKDSDGVGMRAALDTDLLRGLAYVARELQPGCDFYCQDPSYRKRPVHERRFIESYILQRVPTAEITWGAGNSGRCIIHIHKHEANE